MSQPVNLLQIRDARKSFGSRQLFENAQLSINEGEHIGIIGPNGAGKTTFFKLLAGELELDHGQIIRSKQLKLGYLKQHDVWDESQTIEEYLSEGTEIPIWDLKRLGLGLGLTQELWSKPIKSLSGGYRMRAKLLHLLGQRPNLMLLDEPTNYLDLETLLVLESFLQDFDAAFLLISHDREFLKRTTDHIVEIENGDFTKYSGTIDDYFDQKALLRTQLEKQALSDAAKKQEILDFASRFGAKATKARQVQSRLKRLDKMETIELKPLPVAAKIRIPPPTHTGRITLEVIDADLGYKDKCILTDVQLKVEVGSRLAVVGFNGVGKTTLLKSLAKELPILHGAIEYGYQVSTAYYAQHVAERLDPQDTVLSALRRSCHQEIKDQDVLDLAGSLLFSGDQMKKKVSVLSGGEKARVALGQVLLKKSPLLILDEPTNHLDFYTVEALTQALESYAGTVIFVSHDRGFVRRVATKIAEIQAGKLSLYPGHYDDYVWSVQRRKSFESNEDFQIKKESHQVQDKRVHDVSQQPVKIAKASPKTLSPYDRDKIKELEIQKRQCDKLNQDFDRKIKALQGRINEQSLLLSSGGALDMSAVSREVGLMQKKIEELEEQFLKNIEHRETIIKQIDFIKGRD